MSDQHQVQVKRIAQVVELKFDMTGRCPCCKCKCGECGAAGHCDKGGCCSKGCNNPGKKS